MSVDAITETTQYLTFQLDEELYALGIAKVQSVLDFDRVTKVPKTPDFMRGVINLRGNVVPIIDLRLKFGMSDTQKTVDSCIIIVEIEIDNEITVLGCLADSVKEVIDLVPEEIEPAPKIGTRLKTEFIKGMGKQGDDFIIILDLDRIFSAEDILLVHGAGDDADEGVQDVQEEKKLKRKMRKKTDVAVEAEAV